EPDVPDVDEKGRIPMNLPRTTGPLAPTFRNAFKLHSPPERPSKCRTNSRSVNWLTPWRPSPACIAILVLGLVWGTHYAGAQGALTNGWAHTGTISPAGDSDAWTFSAG